ncbi:hypothetical protein D3C87_948700 [compost metagenome]
MDIGQGHHAEEHGLHRASQPCKRGRQHEGRGADPVDVVAQRRGARRVVAHRHQHLPERRVDGAVDQEAGQREEAEEQVVQRLVVAQVDPPQQRAARDALQSVLAAQRRPLQHDEECQLRQGQRDHREVDALASHRQAADDPAQRRGQADTDQDAQLERHAPDGHRVTGCVARAAEEGGVAERQQAAVAQQQVEGAGKQCKADQLHQQHRVHEGGGQQTHRKHQQQRRTSREFHFSSPCRRGRPAASAARRP